MTWAGAALLFKPTQPSVRGGILFYFFFVLWLSCNLQITLHLSTGGTGNVRTAKMSFPGWHFASAILSIQNIGHFLSALALWCHPPRLSVASVLFKSSFFPGKLLFMDFCLFSAVITNNTVNSNHLLFGAGADACSRSSEVRILIWRLRKVLTGPIYNQIIL